MRDVFIKSGALPTTPGVHRDAGELRPFVPSVAGTLLGGYAEDQCEMSGDFSPSVAWGEMPSTRDNLVDYTQRWGKAELLPNLVPMPLGHCVSGRISNSIAVTISVRPWGFISDSVFVTFSEAHTSPFERTT